MEIRLTDVEKEINGIPVLREISFSMESGQVYGLRGKNGSGKTMLMRAVCGLIRPDRGSITVGGVLLGKETGFPESLGVLIEKPAFLAGKTGLQNLRILADLKQIPEEEAGRALERVGLDPRDRRVYRKYSLGMRQKLGIAAAILGTPKVVVLDEPFNALDEESAVRIGKIVGELKEAGSLVLLSCHDSGEMEALADAVIEMAEGKIAGIRRKHE